MAKKKSESPKKNGYDSILAEAVDSQPQESAKKKSKGTGVPGRETL